MKHNRIAFVIATKDRPKDIRQLLDNISGQSILPDRIIIVDSSVVPVEFVTREFPGLNIEYVGNQKPSASAQRNTGINIVGNDIDLIGFLDDDVILEKGSLEAMMRFWSTADEDIGGCAFNLRNFAPTGLESLKHSGLAENLGLYSEKRGMVMPSGWATMIGEVSENIFVQWMPSTAAVWRKNIFDRFKFEEQFGQYSYLEDLDFSYGAGRKCRLMVIADAGYFHYHSASGRINQYQFGKMEVANRVFFVEKHNLSLARCHLAIFIRMIMTILSAVRGMDCNLLRRSLGNCIGLLKAVVSKKYRGD